MCLNVDMTPRFISFLSAASCLYTTDVVATHAATAVDEEQQLSGGFVQLQRLGQ